MTAIKLENVSFSYSNGQKNAVENLSLEIKQGSFTAIVGRNGSGKSTLARLINGLLLPQQGTIEVFGKRTSEPKNLFEIRKSCGIVFQNPDNQTVASLVEDDVAFGPENIGVSRSEIGERIDFALKSCGIEQFRNSSATQLSGGQKQRVAIAGVLALMPKIVILDESTAMLDPNGRKEVLDVVKRLNKEQNMTVLLITHFMDETVDCDEIVVLNDGELIKKGSPLEIFSISELLYSVGLDLPLPLRISNRLMEIGVDVGENLCKEELAKKLCESLQTI